jgi:hypothetical protein
MRMVMVVTVMYQVQATASLSTDRSTRPRRPVIRSPPCICAVLLARAFEPEVPNCARR